MKPCLIVLVLMLMSWPVAGQQTAIENGSPCNVNIVGGDGNNVTIDCRGRHDSDDGPKNVRLVIGSNNTPIVSGLINWDFINPSLSHFALEIDEEEIIYQTMDNVFEDERVTLESGEHFYRMEVSFQYINGVSARTSCSGIVDAQISASVVPRLAIAQNAMNGNLSPINCGFQLR
ncbi:hypothetical protein HFC70_24365 [Agrobacterium sp. a22-2]|uniref:hypothetical protein n=1 Tax=Agrobacterium sp. a22-2 TaxID=2283840 RepID=UPI0014470D83|nr:hypothetical protein [Agrobacterium sp. a22-2]NKN39486.1 hypothetical protein [Agrobacterium sp. a22-2]